MRLAVLLGALAVIPLSSQDAPIQVTTRLVQVNVIVSEKNGPVADLVKDDFTLLDGKRQRKIATFSRNVSHAKGETQTIAQGANKQNIYSNRSDERRQSASVTVILLDSLNTPTADRVFARGQVLKLLSSLDRDDRVAIYAMGSRLWILQDFTTNYAALRHAIEAATIGSQAPVQGVAEGTGAPSEGGMYGAVIAAMDAFLASSDNEAARLNEIERGRITRASILAIAKHLAKVPGRKNLVWISGSFPITVRAADAGRGNNDPGADLREHGLMRIFNESNISVYPVDARGLVGVPVAMTAAEAPLTGMMTNRTKVASLRQPAYHSGGREVMNALADGTGGRIAFGTNDVSAAIKQAIQDTDVTYTLGFYPESGELDGKFHELKVKVNRPNVEVRARKGYLAAEEQAPTPEQMITRVKDAATGPLDVTEIALTAKMEPIENSHSLRFSITIEVRDLAIENKSGKWTGAVELFVVQRAEDRELANTDDVAGISATEERMRNLRENGFQVAKSVTPEAGVHEFRVIVLDRSTGRVGSVRMPANQTP
jgi:VWFA-related protein